MIPRDQIGLGDPDDRDVTAEEKFSLTAGGADRDCRTDVAEFVALKELGGLKGRATDVASVADGAVRRVGGNGTTNGIEGV